MEFKSGQAHLNDFEKSQLGLNGPLDVDTFTLQALGELRRVVAEDMKAYSYMSDRLDPAEYKEKLTDKIIRCDNVVAIVDEFACELTAQTLSDDIDASWKKHGSVIFR